MRSSHGSRVAVHDLERVETLPNSLHRIGEILGQHPRERARHPAAKDDPTLRDPDFHMARGVELLVEQADDLVLDGGVVPADQVRRRGAELRRPPIDAYGGVGLGHDGRHRQRHLHRAQPRTRHRLNRRPAPPRRHPRGVAPRGPELSPRRPAG